MLLLPCRIVVTQHVTYPSSLPNDAPVVPGSMLHLVSTHIGLSWMDVQHCNQVAMGPSY